MAGFNEPPSPPPSAATIKIQFSKEFKEGPYEYFRITINQLGAGQFEVKPRTGKLMTDELKVSTESVRQILANLDAANFLNSKRDYESRLKVADMGLKKIFFQKGTQSREVEFNYTINKNINAIAEYFSGLATTELRIDSLETALKYDKLGLPEQIKGLDMEMSNHWLSETPLLLPILRQIANDSAVFNMVQRKAHQLILEIETANPSTLN